MNRKLAENIAKDFLSKFNPDMWDGTNEKPESFNDYNYEVYDINNINNNRLYIQFKYDEEDNEWCHNCSLYNEQLGQTMEILSGYGVDSVLNLIDTIEDICSRFKYE